MAIMIHTDPGGTLRVTETDADAITGRWCEAPSLPDRCMRCFNPGTLSHLPAQGYFEIREGKTLWREGVCRRCAPGRKKEGRRIVWLKRRGKARPCRKPVGPAPLKGDRYAENTP